MARLRRLRDCAGFDAPLKIMRKLTRRFLAVLCLAMLGQPVKAESGDDSLLAFAVNIHRTPMQSWGPGYGIYLGHGLFITAAHVAGRTWFTRPKVAIAGIEYPTKVVKAGDFETVDLTVLSVDETILPSRLALRHNILCAQPPWPGQPVVTVVPEGTARSRILAPQRLPLAAQKFNTVISDVAQTGNSGSGVFDANQKCLLGIMSRKISEFPAQKGPGKGELRDIAKYFVPTSQIVQFMPEEQRRQLIVTHTRNREPQLPVQ